MAKDGLKMSKNEIIKNIILATDAYKLTHHIQYPKGLTKLYSYGEARVGAKYPTITFFGMQMVLTDLLSIKVTDEMIDEAEELSKLTFGHDYFNRAVWEKVRDLGYFPVKIKALPEGSQVPLGTALFTIESTEEWFATTMNALEVVLMHVWYPTTIATNSAYIKRDLIPLVEQTGSIENIDLMVNDFGMRGATTLDAAGRGGAGHLLSFRGSDNMYASKMINDYYGEKGRALSVWATEHSVATSYGPGEGEFTYIKEQLDRAGEDAVVSIVIDSYDSIGFIKNVVGSEEISQIIKARTGRSVMRPDSGDPLEVVPEILDELEAIFGTTKNDKGYKILNDNVGVIQGDGMHRDSIKELYQTIIDKGWSTDNLVVGSGGGLLQEGFTRDTLRFAIKASYGEDKDHQGFDIHKQPKQDASKNSKAGQLKVILENGEYKTVRIEESDQEDVMRTVYQDGQFFNEDFQTILKRANDSII